MSVALMPTKLRRPRTVEQILGPKCVADLVGLDLQHRQDGLQGSAVVEVHYDDTGRPQKATIREARTHKLPAVEE